MYQITSTQAAQVPDSLHMVLNLAVLFRECEPEVPVDIEVWLLNNEVFALEGLERYEEAQGLIDRFFEAFFDEAPGYYRARFYNWRLYFNILFGNGIGMVADYIEAKQYADSLDATRRAHLHLNGAYAYREIKEYEDALELVDQARALLSEPQTYEDSVALAQESARVEAVFCALPHDEAVVGAWPKNYLPFFQFFSHPSNAFFP